MDILDNSIYLLWGLSQVEMAPWWHCGVKWGAATLELSVLKKGLKIVVTPHTGPVVEMVTATASACRSLYSCDAQDLRARVQMLGRHDKVKDQNVTTKEWKVIDTLKRSSWCYLRIRVVWHWSWRRKITWRNIERWKDLPEVEGGPDQKVLRKMYRCSARSEGERSNIQGAI